jgi:hypothetical protein
MLQQNLHKQRTLAAILDNVPVSAFDPGQPIMSGQ